MSKLNALFAALLTAGALLPTVAAANPIVSVQLDIPPIIIGPRPSPVVVVQRPAVVVRPMMPGPNYVWVDGYWAHNVYGHAYWVDGYWRARPVVVSHQVVTRGRGHGHHVAPSRAVVVKHKTHKHKY